MEVCELVLTVIFSLPLLCLFTISDTESPATAHALLSVSPAV